MSKRHHGRARPSQGDGASRGCIMTVCRGCCCGTAAKHPDVDHPGQLAQLRTMIPGSGRVRTSDCLDTCEHSNVIVVTPTSAGRRRGARPVWLGAVLDEDTTVDLAAWVAAGGPGLAAPPASIRLRTIRPSRRARLAVDPD